MTDTSVHALLAELTWTGETLAPDLAVVVDGGGRIASVGPVADLPPDLELRHLPRRALLPAFVDAHSHAFQRALRGRGESFPRRDGGGGSATHEAVDSFWGWRQAMYELVESLDREAVHRWSLQAFREMRSAGIATVGEFHYLRHDQLDAADPASPTGDFSFDEAVLAAAAEAGIRLVLLVAYYQTGGIGQPLRGGQRRFATPDLSAYWRQMDRLEGLLDPATQSLGVVAHSLRAVPLHELAQLHTEARRRGHVFHLHVEEQRQEVAAAVAAYGAPPMRLLLDRLELGPHVTAVHCTHTEPDHLAEFQRAGGTVCLCPLTEANLGDGVADLPTILTHGGHLALGSDSNARISMLEEMRWLEYVQRLVRERRGVVLDPDGRLDRPLFQAATVGGARSLGLASGELVAGRTADLMAVDLDHPSVVGLPPQRFLTGWILGSDEGSIREVAVAGRWETT